LAYALLSHLASFPTIRRPENAYLDIRLQKCTRRCAELDREFTPGEAFYSVLIAQGADVIRQDFSAKAWQGPPEGTLGWWKSIMPEPDANKVNWAPNDVIYQYFQELEDRPDKADARYVLALLMVRRRLLSLDTIETYTNEDANDLEGGEGERLVLFDSRQENELHVAVVTPSAKRINEIEQELAQLLFSDAV